MYEIIVPTCNLGDDFFWKSVASYRLSTSKITARKPIWIATRTPCLQVQHQNMKKGKPRKLRWENHHVCDKSHLCQLLSGVPWTCLKDNFNSVDRRRDPTRKMMWRRWAIRWSAQSLKFSEKRGDRHDTVQVGKRICFWKKNKFLAFQITQRKM